MPTEPSDSFWFSSGGNHRRESDEPAPAAPVAQPETPARGQSSPYGAGLTYGQASQYGHASTHAQPAQPTPAAPPPAYNPPTYSPSSYTPPAYTPPAYAPPSYTPPPPTPSYPTTPAQPSYGSPAPPQPAYPPPTQPAPQPSVSPITVPLAPNPVRQPLAPGPVRQPTGEYPTQRGPGGPLPARRPFPTGAHPIQRPAERGEPPALQTRTENGGSRRRLGQASRGVLSHGHSHDAQLAVSRRTTRIMTWILIPCAIATVVAMVLLWPNRPNVPPASDGSVLRAYGDVVQIIETPCGAATQGAGPAQPCGTATVHVTSGQGTGQNVAVDLPQGPGTPALSVGSHVVLEYANDPTSATAGQYQLVDIQRGNQLLLMVGLCALVVVLFGRLRGLTALIGLGVSFAFLLFFILPALMDGASPLPVAIVGASAIMLAVPYLTNGFNTHTSVAVLGTLASLVLTGLLGALFTAATSLTGFGDENSLYLSIYNSTFDARGLLLAGIIIGALGVLVDVTVTQATTVAELAHGATSRLSLYQSAIRIGRSHVAATVPTLIMAYAGASLPLLLLIALGGQDMSDVLSSEFMGEEIVRAAIGTLGLVAAVPITTGLAVLVADLRHRGESADERPEPRPDGRPEPRLDGRPEPRPDGRPEPRPEGRPGPRLDTEHRAEAVAGR
ncbi:MAG TPA: YibE/F family protein [Micromonosporaceae bacterium]